MNDFLVWYFNLSAWGAIEFFFKALLLMVLFSVPMLIGWAIVKRIAHHHTNTAKTSIIAHSGRELAKKAEAENAT